jgi:hypothetical protein
MSVTQGRSLAAGAMTIGGLLLTAVGVLDPLRARLSLLGIVFAAAGWALAPWERWSRKKNTFLLAVLLSAAWATAGWVQPEFRADAGSYYVYLRSLFFDRDLDFRNDWQGLGQAIPPPAATGLPRNTHAVGPALLWSPFFAAAHIYVRVDQTLGRYEYTRDGFSAPYRRAPVLGTVTAVILAAVLLFAFLARSFGHAVAGLAVVGSVAASTVLYYTFVLPAMAHGAAFAAGAALLWACDRVRQQPSAPRWLAVGAFLGLAVLMRWQAAVHVLLVIPLAVFEWRRGAARVSWILGAAALAYLCVIPQLVAWRVLFGDVGTVPQGPGYMNWWAPHLQDVLFSANHGLFTWTPAALLGLGGLVVGYRRAPLFCGAGLAVFAITAWINGSVAHWDWEGGDSFGARRFDIVVPFFALGLASLLEGMARLVRRTPLLAPALFLTAFVLWNLGFISVFRQGRYSESAPFRNLVVDQARLAEEQVMRLAKRVGGERGRALAYRSLSGQYLDTASEATIDLAKAEERLLLEGWSARANRLEAPTFRWAFHPEACVLIALQRSRAFSAEILARAPRRALPQSMEVLINGSPLISVDLAQPWSVTGLEVPAHAVREGENRLCLRFANAVPGDDSQRAAAAISRLQLKFVP